MQTRAVHGRATTHNPGNRFDRIEFVPDGDDLERPSPQTIFLADRSKSAFSYNDSPDVGFSVSINPYRGCEHGCIYCYARPTHEYLGLSAGFPGGRPSLCTKSLRRPSEEQLVLF